MISYNYMSPPKQGPIIIVYSWDIKYYYYGDNNNKLNTFYYITILFITLFIYITFQPALKAKR